MKKKHTVAPGVSRTLTHIYKGPYTIVKVGYIDTYTVRIKCRCVHANELKRYYGREYLSSSTENIDVHIPIILLCPQRPLNQY